MKDQKRANGVASVYVFVLAHEYDIMTFACDHELTPPFAAVSR